MTRTHRFRQQPEQLVPVLSQTTRNLPDLDATGALVGTRRRRQRRFFGRHGELAVSPNPRLVLPQANRFEGNP